MTSDRPDFPLVGDTDADLKKELDEVINMLPSEDPPVELADEVPPPPPAADETLPEPAEGAVDEETIIPQPETLAPDTSAQPPSDAPALTTEQQLEQSQALNEQYKAALGMLTPQQYPQGQQAPQTQQAQPIQQIPTPQGPAQPQSLEFVSKEEFEQGLDSPEAFNKMLSRVYMAAKNESMGVIPQIVQTQVQTALALNNLYEGFFTKYPQLRNHADVFAYIVADVDRQHPGMMPGQVLEMAGQEAIKRLRLDGQPAAPMSRPTQQPSGSQLPLTGTTRRPQRPKLSNEESEIAGILKGQF